MTAEVTPNIFTLTHMPHYMKRYDFICTSTARMCNDNDVDIDVDVNSKRDQKMKFQPNDIILNICERIDM